MFLRTIHTLLALRLDKISFSGVTTLHSSTKLQLTTLCNGK
jgi:hypothetical protein